MLKLDVLRRGKATRACDRLVVSYSLLWMARAACGSNAIILGFRRCARWLQDLYWFRQNVPTSSHWRLALPALLMIKARSRGYKQAREGGEAPNSLIYGGGGYKVESWLSLGFTAGLWPWVLLLFIGLLGVISSGIRGVSERTQLLEIQKRDPMSGG
jgi:hypothetical protein